MPSSIPGAGSGSEAASLPDFQVTSHHVLQALAAFITWQTNSGLCRCSICWAHLPPVPFSGRHPRKLPPCTAKPLSDYSLERVLVFFRCLDQIKGRGRADSSSASKLETAASAKASAPLQLRETCTTKGGQVPGRVVAVCSLHTAPVGPAAALGMPQSPGLHVPSMNRACAKPSPVWGPRTRRTPEFGCSCGTRRYLGQCNQPGHKY